MENEDEENTPWVTQSSNTVADASAKNTQSSNTVVNVSAKKVIHSRNISRIQTP